MKWYLVIRTDVGTLDLGTFGNYYATREAAQQDANRVKDLPFVVWVDIKEQGEA